MGTTSPEVTENDLRWEVRFTWACAQGITHPQYTYSKVESEDRAIGQGIAALERMGRNESIRLVEVHWKHADSEQWLKVE